MIAHRSPRQLPNEKCRHRLKIDVRPNHAWNAKCSQNGDKKMFQTSTPGFNKEKCRAARVRCTLCVALALNCASPWSLMGERCKSPYRRGGSVVRHDGFL